MALDLDRQMAGLDDNLQGSFFKGIRVGEEWVYRNPFAPASLTGDEIAIATCFAGLVPLTSPDSPA